MGKTYNILLDNTKIGTTDFENADATMGVVFGRIIFFDIQSGYKFFREYCLKHTIEFQDYPDVKLILTRSIPGLKVFDSIGDEIKGESCYISGMDDEGFEIYIEAIPYPFYQEEFPHHVMAYQNRFNNN